MTEARKPILSNKQNSLKATNPEMFTNIEQIIQQQIMIVQTETSLNLKSKNATCQSTPHTSQEGINLLYETIIDQNDLNDDHCFKCNKEGELYCCDRCFRSFHKICVTIKRFTKVWICEYCSKHHICTACQQPQSQLITIVNKSLICTVCFRFVHRKCCDVPTSILQSKNYFFKGRENFVCKVCVKQFGFTSILHSTRYQRQISTIYYFVRINARSPIHCGWFDQNTLRESSRQLQQNCLLEIQAFQEPRIEKIIRMKIPSQHKHEDVNEILNQLLAGTLIEPNSCYGSQENFYFLGIWKGGDYNGATWEDQKVIFKNNRVSSSSQLVKYLLYRKLQLAIKDKKPLQPIYELFNKYLQQPQPKLKEHSFHQIFNHFKLNTADVNYILPNNNYKQTLDFICFYLQDYYSKGLAQEPSLIICGGSVSQWQRWFSDQCCQLNIVTLRGTETHIYQVKQKDISYQLFYGPKFQIMLLPTVRWNKQKKYLLDQFIQFSHVIFDQQVSQSILDEFQSQLPLNCRKKMYIIDLKKNKNKSLIRHKTKQSSQIYIEEQAFVYNLQSAEVLNSEFQSIDRSITLISSTKVQEKENLISFDYNSLWKDLERVVFLKYVMTFGLNCPGNQMFTKLVAFSKGLFTSDDSDRLEFTNHSKRFLSILNQEKHVASYHDDSKSYFFNIERQVICRRIIKLQILKVAFDNCRNRPQAFPSLSFPVFYKGIGIKIWDCTQDFMLAALILQKGFGKWLEISRTKDWIKWASSCHFEKLLNLKRSAGLRYIDYLGHLLALQPQKESLKMIKIEEWLCERGNVLLKAIVKN